MSVLPNEPLKGFYDWFPDEYKIRQKIFTIWREVCLSFGYEEYLTPTLERAEIYKEKSGEDVGGKELFSFLDRGGREVALRPEMTPGLTRMLSRKYNVLPKPIRYFSIANFFRNEKPQRGRNREFWQLNYDIFGSNSYLADVEILQIALTVMFKLGAPKGSFKAYVNNRKLLNYVILDLANLDKNLLVPVLRILDKFDKLPEDIFLEKLVELGVSSSSVDTLLEFMKAKNVESLVNLFPKLEESEGFIETNEIIRVLKEFGYKDEVVFSPNIIRGFDYYDGMIFEFFDLNPKNKRALFGGGRYNGLGSVFGVSDMPAVGCAPGDEPLRLFIETWGLLPNFSKASIKKVYAPLLTKSLLDKYQSILTYLRSKGYSVEVSLEEQALTEALRTANKRKSDFVLIFGELEDEKGVFKLKNLTTGKEETTPLSVLK